jgi:gas vesicle protein
MINENQEFKYRNNVLGVLVGTLVGALAGAVTVLLFAPQSGEDTRMQIMEKGIELRDQAADMAEDAMSQLRVDRNKFTIIGRRKARKLLKQGQALVAEQLDHVSDAAQAGKKAIQAS